MLIADFSPLEQLEQYVSMCSYLHVFVHRWLETTDDISMLPHPDRTGPREGVGRGQHRLVSGIGFGILEDDRVHVPFVAVDGGALTRYTAFNVAGGAV